MTEIQYDCSKLGDISTELCKFFFIVKALILR